MVATLQGIVAFAIVLDRETILPRLFVLVNYYFQLAPIYL